MGALTPEDTVFRLDAGPGALVFADGLVRRDDGALAFASDPLMGDAWRRSAGIRSSGAATDRFMEWVVELVAHHLSAV